MKTSRLLLTLLLSISCWAATFAQCSLTVSIKDTIIGGYPYSKAIAHDQNSSRFHYLWSNGDTNKVTYRNTTPGGILCVQVTDSLGCTASHCDTLCTFSVSVYDSVQNYNSVLLEASPAGVGPYLYSWNNGLPTTGNNYITTPGTVFFTVVDARGCYSFDSVRACSLRVHIRDSVGYTPILTAHVDDYSYNYTFHWNTSSNSPDIYDPVLNQSYCVTVTDLLGCTASDCNTPCSFSATFRDSVSGTNNIYTINTSTGTGPYTLMWGTGYSFGSYGFTINATSGSYPVQLQDSRGCYARDTVVINSCNFRAYISTAALGSGDRLTVPLLYNGTAPYTYHWSDGSTGAADTVHYAGIYFCTVTDALGCTAHPGDTLDYTHLPCNVRDSLTYSVAGANYTFNAHVTGASSATAVWWDVYSPTTYVNANSVGSHSAVYTLVGGQTYHVLATTYDSVTQCGSQDSLVITAQCNLSGYISMTRNGSTSGTLHVHTSGGSGHLRYQWFGSGIITDTAVVYFATNYCVKVTDSVTGCVDSFCYVYNLCTLAATESHIRSNTNVYTFALTNITGGTAPYHVSWTDNGSAIANSNVTLLTDSLRFGFHQVCVNITDSTGCTASYCDTFTVPALTSCNISVAIRDTLYGTSIHGKYAYVADTHNSSFTYHWNTAVGSHSDTLFGLYSQAYYCVTVTDGLGCTAAACDTGCNLYGSVAFTNSSSYGTLTANVAGGTGNYSYTWSNNIAINHSSGNTALAFANDIYYVTVRDITTGCSIVLLDSVLNLNCNVHAQIGYNNLGNGHYAFTAYSSGSAHPRYTWYTSTTSATGTTFNTTLPTGHQYVTLWVIDSLTGCTNTDSILFTVTACHLHARILDSAHAGYHTLYAIADTGTPGYSYHWTGVTYGGATTQSIAPFINGNYCVTITDANGCTAAACDSVYIPCVMQVHIADSNYSGYHLLHASSTGGSPGTTLYQWTNPHTGAVVGGYADYTATLNSTYCVTRTDTNGCRASACDSVVVGCALSAAYTYTNVGDVYTFTATNPANIARYLLYVDWALVNTSTVSPFTVTLAPGAHAVGLSVFNATNTCRDSVAHTITAPTCNTAGYMTDSTYGTGGYHIFTAHVTSGPAPYTYRWNYAGTTSSINVIPGFHLTRCVVTDANGCSVTLTDTVANNHCGNGGYQYITATVSGSNVILSTTNPVAVAPNSYFWSNGATTQSITVPDTFHAYCVSIIDWDGCSSSACDTVYPPGYCTATISTIYHPNNTVLHTHVSGGGTTHTYHWSNGSSADSLVVTTGGTYCVTITDATGCSAVTCSTVTVGCHITGTITAHSINTSAVVLTATVTGGSGTYAYTWTGGHGGTIDTVYNTGNYCVTVTDGTGCSAVLCDTARLNCVLSNSLTDTITAPGCVYNGGTAHIGVVGGTGVYQYRNGINGTWQSSNIITGLSAGTDTFYVVDANGCSKSIVATLVRTSGYPAIAPTSNSPVAAGGTITLTANASGYTGSVSYSWTGPNGFTSTAANPTIPNATAAAGGTYHCTVSTISTTSCNANGLVNVVVTGGTSCTLAGHVTAQNNTTYAILTATATGAHGTVTYHWSNNASTSALLTVTASGSYCVTMTDTSGCSVVACDTVTLGAGCTISQQLTDTLTMPGCNSTGGVVKLGVVGGTSTYQYKNGVNGTYQTSNTFTGLSAGTYTFYVKDANGCTQSTVVVLTRSGNYVTVSPTSNSPVAVGGTITLYANAANTSGITTYSWTGPNGFTSTVANPTITNATAAAGGPYSCTVHSGSTTTCSANGLVNVVVSGSGCTLGAGISNQSTSTYSILTALPTGAHGGVTYHWSNNASTNNVITVTASGYYCVTVTDTAHCSAVACSSVSIGSCTFTNVLTDTVTNPSCAANGGAVHLGVTAGTSAYLFKNGVNGGYQASNIFSGLTAGTDTFYVRDANGCTKSIIVTLTRSSTYPTVTPTSNSPVAAGGTLTLFSNLTGGTGTISYSWTGPNGFTSTAANPTIPNVTTAAAGAYQCTVHSGGTTTSCSANGLTTVVIGSCSLTGSVTLAGGNPTGVLTAHATGAHGTVTYHWSNNTTAAALTVTTAGTYCVTITDTTGCSAVVCTSFRPVYSDTICGTVFHDTNNDGVEDNGEAGIPGQYLFIEQGNTYIGSVLTDANGHYTIGVPAGTYSILTSIPVGSTTIPISTGTSGYASYSTVIATGGGHHCGYDFGVVDSNIIISGYVYLDANNNGIKDAGETGVANQQIHIGPHSVYTNSSGYYAYTDVRGSYSLTYVPTSTYSAYTVTPSGFFINATAGGASYAGNNFGLYLAATTCNIATTVVPITTITAGYPSWYNVYVQNYGTNSATGTMTFYYDPALIYTYSNPTQTSVNTTYRYVTFNYTNILPGQYAVFTVNFNAATTVTPGQSTFEMATATDNCNETNYADNTDTLHQTATASWDPNLKIVTPSGAGPQGLVTRDQELRYTIAFQNTGNAPAVNIVLQDELPAVLDISTFRVLAASHPDYTLELNGNHLTCRFSQIMLPDSAADERGSHGFLSFAILPVGGLSDGTTIQNTADIYFDYNDAVVTNTTLNTIDYTLSVHDVENHATITVMPNPFSVYTTIRVTGADIHDAILDVYDGLGQVVTSATPTQDGVFTLSRGNLSAGMYSYHIRQSGHTVGTGKLVIE